MPESVQPKGPSLWEALRSIPRLRRDPLGTMADCVARYGDFVRVPTLQPTFILSNPADIRHVMVANAENYHKTGGLKIGGKLFGNGLLASEEPLHMTQRRVMQPMFHARRLSGFAAAMTDAIEKWMERWQPGQTLDFAGETMRVTITIVSQTLFSMDYSREAPEINRALTDAQRHIYALVNGLAIIPPVFRPRGERRYRANIQTLDDFAARLIREHRAHPERYDDLLSMLLDVRFEDGSAMSETQVRDEVMNLLNAGHETTANALAWLWFVLDSHPEVETRLLDEYRTVLGGRTPTFEDLPRLTYTAMVFAETLRLYPPVWLQARRALGDDVLPGGGRIPKGAEVAMIAYVVQRNAAFYPDPEKFDPERFNPANKQERPAFAYFPFAGGSRLCLGEGFARLEAALVMAMVLPRFRLRLAPGHRVEPEPLLTLRPKNGLWMTVEPRTPATAKAA